MGEIEMTNAISVETMPSLPVVGSAAAFPVRRVFCVGRNYADHVAEMGGDPKKDPPVFFTKHGDTVVASGGTLPFPRQTNNLHHEVELVVALQSGGQDMNATQATEAVFGYGVGVDFTRRDLQADARKAGMPWDMAKNFDHAAPVGAITPAAQFTNLHNARITLAVNDQKRQDGTLADMIWSVPEIIQTLSRFVTLKAGDIIFTGTPDGVSQIESGDVIIAEIEGLQPLHITLA
jgi:fumarylpyruvate hydrolase